MDLTLLEHFLVIAETQSFTKAANILDKSESVLSRQMSRLEHETGLALFDRSSRRITLTPAAKVFRAGVSEFVNKYHQTVRDAMDIQTGISGIVHLGIFENHLLPDRVLNLLDTFQQQYPKIQVRLEPYDILVLRQMLMDGQLDLLFTATMEFQDGDPLVFLPYGPVDIAVGVSRKHRLASRPQGSLCLADFRNDLFIARGDFPVFPRRFTQTCEAAGFQPKYFAASSQTQILTMMQMNSGVCIIDNTHFFARSNDIVLFPLAELAPLQFGFTYNRENVGSCCQVLLDYLRTHLDSQSQDQ